MVGPNGLFSRLTYWHSGRACGPCMQKQTYRNGVNSMIQKHTNRKVKNALTAGIIIAAFIAGLVVTAIQPIMDAPLQMYIRLGEIALAAFVLLILVHLPWENRGL